MYIHSCVYRRSPHTSTFNDDEDEELLPYKRIENVIDSLEQQVESVGRTKVGS